MPDSSLRGSGRVASTLLSALLLAVALPLPAHDKAEHALTLLAPPDQSELRYPDARVRTLLLTWSAVPGATRYRVVVARTPDLQRPAVDRQSTRSSVEVRGLSAGRYHWRVEALSASEQRIGTSATARFSIAQGEP